MKTGLTLVAFATVVGALVFAWTAAQRADAAQIRLVTLTTEQQDLATRVAAAQRRIHASEQKQSEVTTALVNAQAELKRRKAVVSAPKASLPSQNTPVLAVLLDRNPKLHDLYRAQFEADIRLRYLPFFRQQQFSPDQQQRFIALLDEWDQGRLDVQEAAAAQHYAPNDPAMVDLQKKTDATVDEKLKTLLGEDGFAQMRQFQSAMRLENPVNDISSMVASEGNALNQEQATRLFSAFVSARDPNGTEVFGDKLNADKLTADAKTFLSPPQMAALHAELGFAPLRALVNQFYAQQKPAAGAGATK
jgi:hypothetical protein